MSSIRRRFYLDHDASGRRRLVHHTQQDCTEILRRNRALYNAERRTTALRAADGWVRVASIPLAIAEGWAKQGARLWSNDDAHIIRRLLNDSDWRSLRTAPGRI